MVHVPALSTGFAALDHALQGLWWGDNVVWELREGASPAPLYLGLAEAARAAGHRVVHVPIDGPRAGLDDSLPEGVETIAAAAGPGELVRALEDLVRLHRGRLVVLVDGLDQAYERWGEERARELFTRVCPTLLRYAAIAYWCCSAGERASLREHVRAVTQCALTFGGGWARVLKAEGRPSFSQGVVLRYEVDNQTIGDGGALAFHELPAAARLGMALRAVRTDRGLTQRALADLMGVTPSAVSQAERGERSLSLETALRLSESLGMTIDALLHADRPPAYRVARVEPGRMERSGESVPVFEDPALRARVTWLRLMHGESARLDGPDSAHWIYAVASGLCQFQLATGSPVLRAGEVLSLLEPGPPPICRNLAAEPAAIFGLGWD